jgi:hypothetical protein
MLAGWQEHKLPVLQPVPRAVHRTGLFLYCLASKGRLAILRPSSKMLQRGVHFCFGLILFEIQLVCI